MPSTSNRRNFLFKAVAAGTAAAVLPWQSMFAKAAQLPPGGGGWQPPGTWVPNTSYLPLPNLGTWLANHPKVRDAIIWERSDGSFVPYTAWGRSQAELTTAFANAFRGVATGLPKVPTNIGAEYHTVISSSDAWKLYLAHVAHGLAVELRGDLPWSLTTMPTNELEILFASRHFFAYNTTYAGYEFNGKYGGGFSTLAPPDFVYGFLQLNGIPNPAHVAAGQTDVYVLRAQRMQATARLLDWCGDKMSHFQGWTDQANLVLHWQYAGCPPVARVIEGTINPDFSPNKRHWTAGCFGTSAFLRAVMRTMNIAVDVMGAANTGHIIPHFLGTDTWLSHGDDPYTTFGDFSARVVGAGLSYPRIDLILSAATHDAWSDPLLSYEQRLANVGRRVNELSVQYLTLGLLVTAINDKWMGKSHADGNVYDGLKNTYTLPQLEWYGLWTKIDAKIAAQGGEDVVMALYDLASLEKES